MNEQKFAQKSFGVLNTSSSVKVRSYFWHQAEHRKMHPLEKTFAKQSNEPICCEECDQ